MFWKLEFSLTRLHLFFIYEQIKSKKNFQCLLLYECISSSFLAFLFKKMPQACNFVKKGLWHRCFPVNFVKFLRTPLLTEHLRWLLLDILMKAKFWLTHIFTFIDQYSINHTRLFQHLQDVYSVMRGRMRRRGIMRQMSCYGFHNQFGRKSVKSILFHGNWRLYFQTNNNKNYKKSHDVNEQRYLSCAICLFLVAAAFLMSSEIY